MEFSLQVFLSYAPIVLVAFNTCLPTNLIGGVGGNRTHVQNDPLRVYALSKPFLPHVAVHPGFAPGASDLTGRCSTGLS